MAYIPIRTKLIENDEVMLMLSQLLDKNITDLVIGYRDTRGETDCLLTVMAPPVSLLLEVSHTMNRLLARKNVSIVE